MKRIVCIGAWAALCGLTTLFGAPTEALACRLGIGDRVWYDANRNGIQDSDEPGLNGVRVTISPGYYANRLDESTYVDSMITATGPGGDGYYLFQPVYCGVDYTVAIDPASLPLGLLPTDVGVGGNPALDSDNPAGTVVNLADTGADYSNLTIDFGFVAPACTGTIGNRVWYDTNKNGLQDPGEGDWEGALVTLTPGGSLSTDANGAYLFTGLCAGTYQVCVSAPPGTAASPFNQGTDDEIDSDGEPTADGACTIVTLPAFNTTDLTNDFGFYEVCDSDIGTGTPGYWKQHPGAWPVESIEIGGRLYSKAQAVSLMKKAGSGGDKSLTMFMHLVATKLNLLAGTCPLCISGTVGLADDWLRAFPAGSNVRGSSMAWKKGEPLATQLDRYNNGMLCAPSRDDDNEDDDGHECQIQGHFDRHKKSQQDDLWWDGARRRPKHRSRGW
ncbi:MAG: SdrD B-like domain-containing protein [Vicinamibacterales bacterium]